MRRTVAIAAAAASAILVLAALGAWATGNGDYPSWVEALATLAAFIAASIAVRYANDAFQIERQRDERWLAAQKQAQASMIAAWWGAGEEPGTATPSGFGLWVRNASELPVTMVELEVMFGDDDIAFRVDVGLVPPSAAPKEIRPRDIAIARRLLDASSADLDIRVSIFFSDSSYHSWVRTWEGNLIEQR